MRDLGPNPGKAERTRDTILEVAESVFAEKGFAAARLEEVAERVGIRRASIVYHFRDKRELYSAVLGQLVTGLLDQIAPVLDAPGPLAGRIELAVSAFVDFVADRPTAVRILLREIADGSPDHPPELLRHMGSIAALAARVIEGGERMRRFPKADPIQIASAIAGTTMFHLAAVPILVRGSVYDPRQPERLEALRAEVLSLTRRLLGEHSGTRDE